MERFLWLPGTKLTGGFWCREKEGQGLFPHQGEIPSIFLPINLLLLSFLLLYKTAGLLCRIIACSCETIRIMNGKVVVIAAFLLTFSFLSPGNCSSSWCSYKFHCCKVSVNTPLDRLLISFWSIYNAIMPIPFCFLTETFFSTVQDPDEEALRRSR